MKRLKLGLGVAVHAGEFGRLVPVEEQKLTHAQQRGKGPRTHAQLVGAWAECEPGGMAVDVAAESFVLLTDRVVDGKDLRAAAHHDRRPPEPLGSQILPALFLGGREQRRRGRPGSGST